MTDAFVDRVDDCLSAGADLVDILIQIENPAECLLRRRDIVALGAEYDDGGSNVAEVDRHAIAGLNSTCREIVADEQLVDNELDLLGVQIDVTTPPALEPEIARSFGVNLGVEIVLLAPQRVRRIEVLEILHKPGTVKFSMAEIAGHR